MPPAKQPGSPATEKPRPRPVASATSGVSGASAGASPAAGSPGGGPRAGGPLPAGGGSSGGGSPAAGSSGGGSSGGGSSDSSSAGSRSGVPSPGRGRRAKPTARRILDAALAAFGSRGFEATSLDDLARELGIRKQTILYWYPSKEALLAAVVDHTAAEVTARLERAIAVAEPGFGRIEAIVRDMSRLVARYPTMLGFVREVSRLGPPASTRLTAAIAPLVDRASGYLAAEMDAGRMRRHDPRLLLLAAYSMVTGLGTEVEVLRAFGEEPTLASLVRRRDELLTLLRGALVPG